MGIVVDIKNIIQVVDVTVNPLEYAAYNAIQYINNEINNIFDYVEISSSTTVHDLIFNKVRKVNKLTESCSTIKACIEFLETEVTKDSLCKFLYESSTNSIDSETTLNENEKVRNTKYDFKYNQFMKQFSDDQIHFTGLTGFEYYIQYVERISSSASKLYSNKIDELVNFLKNK